MNAGYAADEWQQSCFRSPLHVAEGRYFVGQSGYNNTELTGVRVLVVEDNLDTQELFCTVLRASGAETKGVVSAEEALETLLAFNPDVLVADIGLPGEDGYSLIRRVRTLPPDKGGNIPAMAVTAYTKPEDKSKALWKGYQMHVPKPIDPDDLVFRVAALFGPHDEPESMVA
jgi:CheY-like chemotaxis protein